MCKWVKASERLPGNGLVHFRNKYGLNDVVFYSTKIGFYKPKYTRGTSGMIKTAEPFPLNYPLDCIEWLDESDTESELREQVSKLREGVGEIANYGTFLTADDAYEMNELAKQLLKETE